MHESGRFTNDGVVNLGGTNNFTRTAIGSGAVVNNGPDPRGVNAHASGERREGCSDSRWDVGVVTILAEEARAVYDAFSLEWLPGKLGGLFFATGSVGTKGRPVSVVATRSHAQGQRSAMAACEHLRRHFDPDVLMMVGIGGGIGLDADAPEIGDVVVGTRVVFYDLRKETPNGIDRRGEERESPADMVHSVNTFFTVNGEPARLGDASSGTFRVFPSPIGSGYAVVADGDSAIRTFLTDYNDKILAVDMEAGGLSQYWQENSVDSSRNPGWVVVRGISDRADRDKNDTHHKVAARNAAHVARELLPYLH